MFKQGEILIVPFPFSDLSSIKQRPVIVLSKNSYNEKNEDIITCGITSNLKDSAHSILIDGENLEDGNIPKKSRIKIDKLFTIDQNIIKKKVAQLDKKTFEEVRNEFFKLV